MRASPCHYHPSSSDSIPPATSTFSEALLVIAHVLLIEAGICLDVLLYLDKGLASFSEDAKVSQRELP